MRTFILEMGEDSAKNDFSGDFPSCNPHITDYGKTIESVRGFTNFISRSTRKVFTKEPSLSMRSAVVASAWTFLFLTFNVS